MSTKTDNFINAIAPLVVNEYLSREKWILPSVCIAQAALESGWNLNATSVFGIKGEGFKATTTEYYNGNKTVIEDSFRAYPDLASSVVGYYDFLRDTPRYEKALNNADYKDTVDKLIHTSDGAPYATAPNYIETVISIIEDFDLTRFDSREVKKPVEEPKYHEYVVVRGDSYWAIAEKFGDASRFLELQELNDNKPLYAGNTVKVPLDMVKADTKEEEVIKPVKPVVKPAPAPIIKKGDRVTVVNAINYDNGEPFDKWYEKYDVLEVDGNRAVIGIAERDGKGEIVKSVTTSAIDVKNIKKV